MIALLECLIAGLDHPEFRFWLTLLSWWLT